ncbi:MAG TPA: hypothetical protein DCW68_00040 [Rhodospirillaceae bacterium]|nr:MAG: hypothetical protein A2018_04075 [Alphaproteobacteria bacterium GWF2_58_20]HAU28489.1 hypothetical protein [Rhodospirillaceae bacterium]
MKKVLFSLAMMAILTASAAQAELPVPKIAVVDQIQILRNSDAVKGIEQQFESRRKAFQDEISKQETSLKADEEDLKKKSASLAPEAFRKEREVFEQKVGAAQKKVQAMKADLDADYGKVMKIVQNNMLEIIEGLAKEENVNVILPSHQILLFAPELDITGTVITRLNAKLPKVNAEEAAKAGKAKK